MSKYNYDYTRLNDCYVNLTCNFRNYNDHRTFLKELENDISQNPHKKTEDFLIQKGFVQYGGYVHKLFIEAQEDFDFVIFRGILWFTNEHDYLTFRMKYL